MTHLYRMCIMNAESENEWNTNGSFLALHVVGHKKTATWERMLQAAAASCFFLM